MLVAISFVTAASMQTTKSVKEKVSPLFKIRKQNAINREKINEMKEKIRSWFIEGRVFLQFRLLGNGDTNSIRQQLRQKYTRGYTMHTCCDYPCEVDLSLSDGSLFIRQRLAQKFTAEDYFTCGEHPRCYSLIIEFCP